MQPDFRSLLDKLDSVEKTVNIAEAWNIWGKFLKEAALRDKFHSEVDEAETKTKTKSKVDNKMFRGTNDTQVQSTSTSTADARPPRKRAKRVTLNKAVPMPDLDRIDKAVGKSNTDDDYGNLEMNAPQLAHRPTLALGQDDEPDATELAIIAPVTAETEEIAQRVHNVEWNNMMDLPGNMHQVIRNMGRKVFNAFGEQEFEDIDVIASITNNEEDLDTVAGLVRQFGVPVVQDNVVDFSDTIPGYKAYVGVWGLANQYYMFVKDDFGEYIYTWDNAETDKLQHFEPVSSTKDQARLESINEDMFGENEIGNQNYRGFTYAPEEVEEEDKRYLIHHVLDPQGKRIRTPDSFNNAPGRGWEYPSIDEFKHVVNLYIHRVSSGIA